MVDDRQDSGNKGTDRAIRMTMRQRRVPTGLAERWITAWGLSIVLLFIMPGVVVGFAGWSVRILAISPHTPLLLVLTPLMALLVVAELAARAAPLAIPALAAYHIAARWARGGVS